MPSQDAFQSPQNHSRDGPEIQTDLQMSKEQSGLGHRTDLDSYFRYNDVDEGRDPDGEC
ncbi:MAG: hypothetical protein JW706_06550 [Opitutales bacterium]|nr:hypothetical protein [Opitutales bacterium]